MNNFYATHKPQPVATVDDSNDDDYKEIMNKMTTLEPYQGGDQFADSVLTPYFTALVGEETVAALRDEFVSWTDVRVGTVREMLDLLLDIDHIRAIKLSLAAIYRKLPNIEVVNIEDIADYITEYLADEDTVKPDDMR